MLIKKLETEHFYFDFRHPDEEDTVKIHFHFKSKSSKGKKMLGEKVGGLIVSPRAIQDIHLGKKYQDFFDEIYDYSKKLRKFCKKYLKQNKQYKPHKEKIKGFKRKKQESLKRSTKIEKVYEQFMHPNGDDSIAIRFLIEREGNLQEIGFANISTIGIKELHINPEFEIYFDYIYRRRDRLLEYTKKCMKKNNKFVERMKIDVSSKSHSRKKSKSQVREKDNQK